MPLTIKAPTVDVVDDGYLTGTINPRRAGNCQNCGKHVRCIQVTQVLMPPNVPPTKKFIFFTGDQGEDFVKEIGISCGCYAKGMRQIAYVLAKRKSKGK